MAKNAGERSRFRYCRRTVEIGELEPTLNKLYLRIGKNPCVKVFGINSRWHQESDLFSQQMLRRAFFCPQGKLVKRRVYKVFFPPGY
jgi:hypothetical protein